MSAAISAEQLLEKLQKGEVQASQIVDVRELFEWERIHIEGSCHIPMKLLPGNIDQMSFEQDLFFVCGHGIRSEIVVHFLQELGYQQTFNVLGGFAELEPLMREID